MSEGPSRSVADDAGAGGEPIGGRRQHGHGHGHGHNHGHAHGHEHSRGAGELPHGWYYYGPQPPWAAGPPTGGGADNSELMEAVDRLSRGDVSPSTLGKLFNLNDRDFWTGALVGSAAVLVLTNLPAVKAFVGDLSASVMGGSAAQSGDAAAAEPPPAAAEEKPAAAAAEAKKETKS